MAKDAYYFSHDSNAHKDPKVIRLRRLNGLSGYGLFWCIVEMLRDSPDYRLKLSIVDDIMFELRSDMTTFESLFTCELLKRDDTCFWSDSLIERMKPLDVKREQNRSAGRASAEKRMNKCSTGVQPNSDACSTDVQQVFNGCSTGVQPVKESKLEEKIVKEKPAAADSCPHDDIVAAWHEIMPELARVNVWSEGSRKYLRTRWREDKKRQSVDWWKKLFRHLRDSDFLMGKIPQRPFSLTLGWIVLPNNFEKIANGMYHSRPQPVAQPQITKSTFEE